MFTGLLQLKKHKRTHSKVQCEKCGKDVAANNSKRHIENCKGGKLAGNGAKKKKVIKEFECRFCPYKSDRPSKVDRHEGSVHYKYYCGDCGKQFGKYELLEVHWEKHHNPDYMAPMHHSSLCDYLQMLRGMKCLVQITRGLGARLV